MSDTKISEAQQVLREMEAGAVALLPDPAPDVIRGWAQRLHASLPHLQGDAVPVAWQSMATCPRDGSVVILKWGEDHVSPGWWSAPVSPVQNDDGTWPSETGGFPWAFFDRANRETIVNHAVDTEYGPTHWAPYTHPQPAALNEVSGGHELARAVEKALGNRDGERDAELDELLEMAMQELNEIDNSMSDEVSGDSGELAAPEAHPDSIKELTEAAKAMSKCAYPVSTEIDPRGYAWSATRLDEALPRLYDALRRIEPMIEALPLYSSNAELLELERQVIDALRRKCLSRRAGPQNE